MRGGGQILSNEIIWLMLIVVNFFCITLIYKKLGKLGLYIWIPISVILANLQVAVTLELFGMYATLGNIIYGTGYLATDILSEKYGKESADRGVHIGVFTLIAFTVIMYICTTFNLIDNGVEFKTLYGFTPRICLSSVVCYFISNRHDTWVFDLWRKAIPKYKWVRNNASTLVSQFIDSFLFTILAFYGVLPNKTLIEIFISTFVFKFIVALVDTPFFYYCTKKAKEVEEWQKIDTTN